MEIDILANVEKATSGLQDFILKLGAAYLSYQAITNLIKSSFDIYLQNEKAVAQLGAAIQTSGQNVTTALPILKQYASQMQEISVYSKNTTEETSALLMEIGHLSVEGIQALMPHLMDFASATGMDLPSAAKAAAEAIEGGRNSIGRYKLDLVGVTDPVERLSGLIKQLTIDFHGQSDAIAQTTGGQLVIFKNQINDLKESLGMIMAQLAGPALKQTNLGLDVSKIMGTDLSGASIPQLKSATKALSDYMLELSKEPPLLKIINDIAGPTFSRPIGDLDKLKSELTAVNQELAKRGKGGGSGALIISPPDADAESKGIDKIAVEMAKLHPFYDQMTGQLLDQNAAFVAHAAAVAKAHEELQALIKDTDSYTVAAFKSTEEQQRQDKEMEKTAKAIKDLNDYLNEIADTIVSTGGKDLATLFQEMGSGEDIAASLQRMGAELAKQIGEMMIAAGLQLIIGGNFPAGLALLAAGGLTSIFGGAISGSGGGGTGGSPALPHYQSGTDYVPATGLAILHQGEQVIPAGGGSGKTIIIQNHVYGGMWQTDDLAKAIAKSMAGW